MYTMEELVTKLQNGYTIEDIAQQMSDDLNAAKAEVDRIEAEKSQKMAAERLEVRKRDAIAELVEALNSYLLEFYPEAGITKIFSEAKNDADKQTLYDELATQLDGLVEMHDAMSLLTGTFKPASLIAKTKPEKKTDPLQDFLDEFVRR